MPNASILCAESARASLVPLPRRSLSDDVLDTLRKAIIAGAFAPGDHLAEGALAQRLGVSRAPVREAMVELEREGLLVFNQRGAALVKAFSDDDFEEIFSLRLALETMGARFACRHFRASDAALFAENIERTGYAARVLELTLLDVEFHDLIIQTARHTRLRGSWSGLRHQIEVWLARMHSEIEAPAEARRARTVLSHTEMLEALQSGDEEGAATTMHLHIMGWRQENSGAAARNE